MIILNDPRDGFALVWPDYLVRRAYCKLWWHERGHRFGVSYETRINDPVVRTSRFNLWRAPC